MARPSISKQPIHSATHFSQFAAVMPAPFGAIGITTRCKFIHEIEFLPSTASEISPQDAAAELAVSQIRRYLSDPSFRFTLPLSSRGTPYRRRVWAQISSIPLGETKTYGAIAANLGSAARAVGQACGDNPFPLVIPCHRVIASSGLGGFAHEITGHLMDTKAWLLRHEGVI